MFMKTPKYSVFTVFAVLDDFEMHSSPPPFSIASQGRSVHRSQGCRHAPPRGAHRRLNRPHCTRSINSEKHQGAQMLSLRLTSSSPPRHSCLRRHSCRTTRRTVRRIAGTSPTYRASSAMPSALYEEQQTPNQRFAPCGIVQPRANTKGGCCIGSNDAGS